MFLDAGTSFWLWQFLGRLHPLMVHFPIGVLVVALFLETLTLGGRRPGLRDGIRWLVYIGAATAVLAAIQGWVLAHGEDYGGSTVTYHQWSGITTAALALIAALLVTRVRGVDPSALRPFRAVLVLNVLCLTVAGHLGASLTHGADYLTSTFPWNQSDNPPGQSGELLAELVQNEGLSETDLDRLNLEVRAIFAHTCYKCHSEEEHEGELVLEHEEGVMRGGENGPILIPGDAGQSEIVRRISLPRGHDDAMPSKGRGLTTDEIDLIRLWIDRGAHWSDSDQVFREAELALARPEVPPAEADLVQPIDRFVQAYFEENGLAWPEPVPDRVFIRRVYLDVVGLLPEPDVIAAFEADPAPDKRDRLIDELFGRDHAYAQHWLSFWNDLLRNDYSGTGFITGGRKQITDWLYEALQTNKPYDVMVRELVDPTEASEGFIRGIRWRGAVNASQSTEMQAAQNISQSLMGLNLKCASCHDSFVSNLTLDQAYAFANAFADSTMEIFRCDKPTGRMAQTGFLYPELGDIDGALPKPERLKQLADLLATPDNGRLYRTVANRYWARLLGRGLVEPVDEMDNRPWSQDLLDWLAADLIDHEYDLKYLLGSILRSRAYQLPSVGLEDAGAVTSEAFVFHGPLVRRLTAEQFADALSQLLSPLYTAVAYDPFDTGAEAEWIWFNAEQNDRQALPDPGTYYFRHVFDVAPAPELARAELLIAVDHAFELYVNGVAVESGDDWRQVHRVDVTGRLQAGANVLALEGQNEGEIPNPAGLLLSLKLTYADGRETLVTSDQTWKVMAAQGRDAAHPGAGWEQPGFDDAGWPTVRRFGTNRNNRYWGQLLDFTHEAAERSLPFARASLVMNDPFLKAMGRPTREIVTTSRTSQATLLQALELNNGAFLNEAVSQGATYWLAQAEDDPDELVRRLYLQAFGRAPNEGEARVALERLGERPNADAVQDLLWALVLLPEFQLIY